MTAKEFLQTYGINDDVIYDNAERMHSLECLLEEYAQEQKKLFAIPVVSVSLPSDEEIREPIQNAIYATERFTTDQCTEFADGILTYLDESGYKVVRQ